MTVDRRQFLVFVGFIFAACFTEACAANLHKRSMDLLSEDESVERGPVQPMLGLESDSDDSGIGAAGAAAASVLRINASAAAALNKRGELARKQRLGAKLSGVTLSDASVRAFTKGVKAAASAAGSEILEQQKAVKGLDKSRLAAVANALRTLPPAVAASAAASRFGLPWEEVGGASASAAADKGPWAKVPDDVKEAALEALHKNAAAVTACKGLLKVLRRAAYAAPVAGPAVGSSKASAAAGKKGVDVDAGATERVGSKRKAPGAAVVAGSGADAASTSPPTSKRVRASLNSHMDSGSGTGHLDRTGCDRVDGHGHHDEHFDAGADDDAYNSEGDACVADDGNDGAAAAVAGMSSAAVVKPDADAAVSASKAAKPGPLPKRKVHGRGAGRGRELHPYTGEPRFEDMHPSWQAKRRLAARQAKAVHKSLQVAPAPAVEVPLEAALVSEHHAHDAAGGVSGTSSGASGK